MNKNQTAKILAMLEAYYPGSDVNPEIAVNAWHAILKNQDYEIVEHAVMGFAAADRRDYKKFPSVGQILGYVEKMTNTGDSPEELWNLVYKAISGNPDRAKEAFDSLPKCCQIWLNNPNQIRELGITDIKTVNTVVRGQFLKTIKEIQEREKVQEQLPENVRKAIGTLQLGG